VRLVWTARAKRELGDIIAYIWIDDPTAAKRIRKRIETTAAYLRSQPFMGRPGAIAGTRETIPHPSYRIVYQITGETVFILAVVHTARQWPPAIEDDA
jgi:addiction module RelE/StbE family toxin